MRELEQHNRLMEDYRKSHMYCPECGSDRNSQTLMGYVFNLDRPEEFKNENRVTCAECHWNGIVDDLVGENDEN